MYYMLQISFFIYKKNIKRSLCMEKYNIKVIFDKPNLKVTFENIRAESEE